MGGQTRTVSPACADPLCISESIRGLSGSGGTCGKSCQLCYFLGFPEKAGRVNMKVRLTSCVEAGGSWGSGVQSCPLQCPCALAGGPAPFFSFFFSCSFLPRLKVERAGCPVGWEDAGEGLRGIRSVLPCCRRCPFPRILLFCPLSLLPIVCQPQELRGASAGI